MTIASEAEKLQPDKRSGKGSLYVCKICGNKISINTSGQEEEKDLICCGEYMSREQD
ncbi:MAG TPA: hypothetical protein VHO84_14640 [Syntrophorhabdaceae bacterium]|nr:hypothetical protein [Syntrophorhabdaceae bacterium]